MFKKILIPLDGSDSALKAIEFTSNILQPFEAKVYLLHVLSNLKSFIRLRIMRDRKALRIPIYS